MAENTFKPRIVPVENQNSFKPRIVEVSDENAGGPVDEGHMPVDLSSKEGWARLGRSILRTAPSGAAGIGGVLGGVPGAGLGASIGEFAKSFVDPVTPEDAVTDVAKNTLLQGVLPKVLGNVIGGGLAKFRGGNQGLVSYLSQEYPWLAKQAQRLPGFKAAETVNKLKSYMAPESALVETLADRARPNIAQNPQFRSAPEIANLEQVPYTQTGVSMARITPTAKNILADVSSARNAALLDPVGTRQLAASDLITKHFNAATNRFNVDGLMNTLAKNEPYREALGSKATKTLEELFETAQKYHHGVANKPSMAASIFMEGKRLIFGDIALGILGVPPGTASQLILTGDAIRAVARNPELGQLMIQAAKTPATNPVSPLLNKSIANALRGTTAFLQLKDGSQEQVEFGEDGQIQLPKPQH